MKRQPRLAARLKQRIIIESPVLTPDGAGGFNATWEKFASVWAEVAPKSGGEKLQDEQVAATRRYGVVIRYLQGVKPNMRVLHGGRVLEIKSILNPYEENVMLEISAEETI